MNKNKYTFNMLLDDIQRMPEAAEDGADNLETTSREYQSKLIVMQLLLMMADEYKGDDYRDDMKLRNAIKGKVNIDEHLSGYLFFVSQNPQFDYSWNYMRKRLVGYIDFLANAVCFMKNVLADINMLIEKPWIGDDIHVVFNDVIDVTLLKDEPHVSTYLRWENFYRMVLVKKEFPISIISKDNIVVIGNRKESKDAEKLIDAASRMLKPQPSILE